MEKKKNLKRKNYFSYRWTGTTYTILASLLATKTRGRMTSFKL